MTLPVLLVLTSLAAYLIGAIPFGYLVARWHGVNIFEHGSGNIGATNVGRVLGRRAGILVFVLDFLKGALPTALARWLAPGSDAALVGVVAGLATILGHMFPIYLRLRGGKGVATGAGVVAVLLPWPTLGALLTWIALVAAFRYVSLASLGAAVALCLFHFLAFEPWRPEHVPVTIFCLVAASLVWVRHRANIGRLARGTENRLPESAVMLTYLKTVHVLALGLWFGTAVFFTFVVGPSLFGTFERLSVRPSEERPWWLPVPPVVERPPPGSEFPEPLRKEQGSRLFGSAVGPMLSMYSGFQWVCGIVALATAASWSRLGRVHRLRANVLLLALLTWTLSWWLNQEVSTRRNVRENLSDRVLVEAAVSPQLLEEANAARADFGRWHTYSLFANFATILLVALAMALAAQLPNSLASGADAETKIETPES